MTMLISISAAAEPNGQLRELPNCMAIRLPIISFLPPPSSSGVM